MDFRTYLEGASRLRREVPENLVILSSTDSTNLLARRILREFEREGSPSPGLLLVALEQTRGQGRQGRSWVSPPGLGVYTTLVTSVEGAAELQTLPLLVAVGLCRALEAYLPRACRLKWPNDLLVGDRKIGGILIESISRGGSTTCIVGFGVNHGHLEEHLPPGVRATSLRLEGGELPPLGELTHALVAGVKRELAHLGDIPYTLEHYQACSSHEPGDHLRCRMGGESVEGEFLGFDERGFLRLATPAGERMVAAGEVIEG